MVALPPKIFSAISAATWAGATEKAIHAAASKSKAEAAAEGEEVEVEEEAVVAFMAVASVAGGNWKLLSIRKPDENISRGCQQERRNDGCLAWPCKRSRTARRN